MSLFYKIRDAFEAENAIDYSFYPQFQLISRARDEENNDSLAMRIADPLWMLGRQWQFGEFYGEDNEKRKLVFTFSFAVRLMTSSHGRV